MTVLNRLIKKNFQHLKNINMELLKEIKKYCDLYGWEITVMQLKKQFSLVSWAKNSIPTGGSLTLSTEKLNVNNDTVIFSAIVHKNKSLTLKTNQGYLKFIN